jgi:hypothetical protein
MLFKIAKSIPVDMETWCWILFSLRVYLCLWKLLYKQVLCKHFGVSVCHVLQEITSSRAFRSEIGKTTSKVLTSPDVKKTWQLCSFAIRSFGFIGNLDDKQREIMKDMFKSMHRLRWHFIKAWLSLSLDHPDNSVYDFKLCWYFRGCFCDLWRPEIMRLVILAYVIS